MKRDNREKVRLSAGVAAAGLLALLTATALTAPAADPKPAKGAKPDKPAAKPRPETYTVKRGTFRTDVKLSGVFEATKAAEISLSPEVWAQLSVLEAVEAGTAVKKGQQLVRLDTEKIDKDIKKRREGLAMWDISLKQAEEELRFLEKTTPEKLAAAARDQKRTVQDTERFTKIERPLAEKSADQALKYRADSLEYAREELRQLEKMYKNDDLTEETEEIVLKRQRNAVARAEFALEAAKIEHEKQMKITLPRQAEDVAAARKAKDEAARDAATLLPLALQKKRLETAKARRDAAEASEHFKKLAKDRAAMNVKAPFDGLVYYGQCVRGKWTTAATVAGKLVRGGTLTPDLVFMTVVDPKALRVRASASESQLHLLRKGLKGKATPTGFPNRKLDVQIESVLMVPVAAGQFDVKLALTGDTGPVTPGMTCSITLGAQETKGVISVPASAVHTDADGATEHFVYLKTPGQPQKRVVQVGRTHGGKTEILKGLVEGEVVLLKAPE